MAGFFACPFRFWSAIFYFVAMVLEVYTDGHALLVFILRLASAMLPFVVTAKVMATMTLNQMYSKMV